jgi:hypothetical protein
MAQHANLLGTGLGGAGAAEIAMVAAAHALDALTKRDLTEVSRGWRRHFHASLFVLYRKSRIK